MRQRAGAHRGRIIFPDGFDKQDSWVARVDIFGDLANMKGELPWSMEIHMHRFVTNAGNNVTAAIMAGGVAARVAEGDGG